MPEKPYGYTGKLPGVAPNQNADFLMKSFVMEAQSEVQRPMETHSSAPKEEPRYQKENAENNPFDEMENAAKVSGMRFSELRETIQTEASVNRKSLTEMAQAVANKSAFVVDRKA